MRKIFLLISVFFSILASAQNVTVSGAIAGNGSYATLGEAFTAINGGSQTGANIAVSIDGNTTENVSAVLNVGTWASLTIVPSGGTARSISGAVTGHLIDLNGASNVVIDGLNSGGNTLGIVNTATGASSCIRFIADASNNTVQNCVLQGSASTASNGVIMFGTGVVSGNDGNNINNCTITAAGSNLPINSIFSLGSSASIDNSGNTINANNISDFFSAGTASAGINIGATGNSSWTITNNKLYQTATRTYTTANTHVAISIGTGDGNVITGNTIGYSASNGTGIYTMAGTIATRFIAIGLAVGTSTATSVQANNITAISLATSSGAATANGVICGVNVTAGNVNIGTVAGNIIGAASGTGAIVATPTTTQGMITGINSSSTGTISIQNNTIGALTSSGSTAAVAGGVAGINITGVATSMTISGNTIGNATSDNMRAGTLGTTTGSSIVSGINLTSTPTTLSITNNTIQNLSSYGTGTGGYVRGIQTTTTGTTTAATISNNTLANLTSNNTNTTVSSGQLAAIGIYFASGLNAVLANNTIYNISLTNTGTSGTNATGISVAAAAGTNVLKNRIYGITNASTSVSATAPGTASGIFIRGLATSLTVANNMISLGSGQTSNTAFIGIWGQHGNTVDPLSFIYYNTVHIEGTAASGAQPSFAYIRGDLSTTSRNSAVDIRNNIFDNTRTGGTGKHFAISNNYGATTPSATGWGTNASNYNLLNSANPSTIGYWTSDRTFATWKTTSASDANSLSAQPVTFVNSANDLHLSMGLTATPLESGATTIGSITTDFDSQTRPGGGGVSNGGGTIPDLGADEFDGVPLDIYPPQISYTLLPNTSLVTNRSVTGITITDGTGVNVTAGTNPRLYYKRSTDANTYNDNTPGTDGWKYVEASNGASPFSFTIDYSLLNGGAGISIGNTVQYFFVAQDINATPNVAINSGVFATLPSTVNLGASTFPITGTINSYTILDTISGIKTVGTGGYYATLTGVGGAFADINSKVVTGSITLQIISNITTEDGTNALNALVEEPFGSNYGLSIYPTGSARSVTGTSASALFRLNATDYVTIDGSIGGGGTDRSLTLGNTNTGTSSAVLWTQSNGSDGATNNTFKNLIITGNASTTTLVGIGFGSSTVSVASLGVGNNNNTVQNNSIGAVQYGIYSQGASAVNKNTGTIITQNAINSVAPNNLGKAGIFVGFDDGAQVTSNTIGEITSTGDVAAIALGTLTITTTSSGNEVTNAIVRRNTIGSVITTGAQSAIGIYSSNGSVGTNTIDNNVISGVAGGNTTTDLTAGIYVAGTGTATTRVYFNSVSMTGLRPGTASSYSFALAIGGNTPSVDVQNNILYNTQTSGSATGKSHAIGLHYTSTVGNYANLISNNNVLYASGTHAVLARTASLTGPSNGTEYATLAAWNTESGRDAVGVSVGSDPQFNSATNLLLQTGSPALGAGVTISGFSTDFNGQTRANPPAIGAYETSGDLAGPAMVYTPLTSTVSLADRTIVVNIQDASSVASGADAPRIYYRKNGGAFTHANATSIAGNDYTFTISASVAPGDLIEYYFAAQDLAGTPNLLTSPSGGSGITPPGTTPPATFNSYLIGGVYTWAGGSVESWATGSNWAPVRTNPTPLDSLIFDGGTVTVTGVTTQTISSLTLLNNANVQFTSSATATLTLSNTAGPALNIANGSTLDITSTNALTLAFGSGSTGTVAGTLGTSGVEPTYPNTINVTGAVLTITSTGTLKNGGTLTGNSATTLIMATNSTYVHARNAGSIPTTTFSANAGNINLTFTGIVGSTSITGPASVKNFTWDCPNQTSAFSSSSVLVTVNGNFTVMNTGTGSYQTGTTTTVTVAIAGNASFAAGTWNISGNIISIAGTFTQTGGTIVKNTTNAQNWSAASITQTAGAFNIGTNAGLFTLTATSGNITMAGTVDGGTSGGMNLGFSAASGNQTLTTTGATVSNRVGLTVDKASGKVILANDFALNTGASMTLTNGALDISAGKVLTIGGTANFNAKPVTLKSDLTGTARIAAITGTLTNATAVTTETYIPGGRRAFRFLGHPFSTAVTLNALTDNVFVTGNGGASNGFDATQTNNPSAYWYDNTATAPGAWTAFTSATADNSWAQHKGMRLLVRGDRTQTATLTGGADAPNLVTLDVTGTLNTGNQNVSVPTAGSYHLVGNPYPSPTDIGTVIDAQSANIGTQYWVWDANASTRGAYVTRTVGSGAYNIAMNSAFIVQPTAGATLAFTEANKTASPTTNLFRNVPKGMMELQLLYNNYPADNLFIKLNEKSSIGFENTDGAKLVQSDMNFYTLSGDSKKLSLDARPLDKNDVIRLGLATNLNSSYKIKVASLGFTNNVEMFLKDKFNGTLTPITEGMEYAFDVNSNTASQGEDRFEIVMKQLPTMAILVTDMEVAITPNPVQGQMLITYSSPEKGEATIRLFTNEGKAVKTETIGIQQSGRISWNIKNLPAGTYTIELTIAKQRITKQIIKL